MTKLLRITVTIIDSPLFKTKIMTLLMTFMSLRYYTAICQACGLTTAFQYMLYSMLQWDHEVDEENLEFRSCRCCYERMDVDQSEIR